MSGAYPLFSRFGVELEYMIVDHDTLDVRPVADDVLMHFGGGLDDVCRGHLEWSNELVLHVIELKTGSPATRLSGLAEDFHADIRAINGYLAGAGRCLLPTGMHPWMDPHHESRLWPHGCREIYQAFDRIFDCRGHGWGNLQSVHLNLPFDSDAEFVRLHAAIRVLLPILPAMTASSPFIDGQRAPNLDQRLAVYRLNCRRVPSVTGHVIPEPVRSIAEYHSEILERIYRDLAPHDPGGVLRHEWANARGALARFERNTIEIRLIDIQECPNADLALLEFLVRLLRDLTDPTLSDMESQLAAPTPELEQVLLQVIEKGDAAMVTSRHLLSSLGFDGKDSLSAGEVWQALAERHAPRIEPWTAPVWTILEQGCLSRRIVHAAGPQPGRERLTEVYCELSKCLNENSLFRG